MLSKEDKKIKKWGIHPHFYNIWVQNLTCSWNCWYIKDSYRSSKLLPNTNCSFSVLYSVGHQSQDNFYLDKSIVSWIESLQIDRCNHAMCLIVPLFGLLAILKKKSLASFPLQIRYCRTFNINSHSVLLRNWEKKERQGNKKNNPW